MENSSKHYPTYLALVVGMITAFFLGALLVEIPFSVGLDYFHNLQRDNLIAKQVRAYQERNAARMAEVADSDLQRSVLTCRTEQEKCAQGYTEQLSAGSITEEAWLAGQEACVRTQSSCMANITTE